MKFQHIKELIELVDEKQLTRIDIEKEDFKITICKEHEKIVMPAVEPTYVANQVPTIQSIPQASAPAEATPEEENLHVVKSPMVGTFYSAKSPEADDFVKVGAKVSEGTTLCIIEAMKLMNDIESDAAGEIVEILVKNEDPVEFGQPLFKIRV